MFRHSPVTEVDSVQFSVPSVTSCLTTTVLLAFLLLSACSSRPPQQEPLLVFCAASLAEVMPPLGRAFTEKTGEQVNFHFGPSRSLVGQITRGAPADLLVTASLETATALPEAEVAILAGNRLWLVAGEALEGPWPQALARVERLAVAEAETAPLGVYTGEALANLSLEPRQRVPYLNARAVLTAVSNGSCSAGVVYATDAALKPELELLYEFPASSHRPIVYAAALPPESPARAFFEFIQGSEAGAAFTNAGFSKAKASRL